MSGTMAGKLDLEIVTPERRVVAETVDEVVVPGSEGYLGVLPGHAPLLTGLGTGEVAYRVGDRFHYVAVSGGFAEVLRERVSILAETAERAEEIDLERALAARARAERDLAAGDFDRAAAGLRRAVTRIQVRGRRG
jgi:F-type H+-transporting ATPase subunit epsilon